jgi:hypothetical protein
MKGKLKQRALIFFVCLTFILPQLLIKPVAVKAAGYQDVYLWPVAKAINYSDISYWNPDLDMTNILPGISVYNGAYSDSNAFSVFRQYGNTTGSGVYWSSDDGDKPDFDGISIVDGHFYGTINVGQVPALKRLAEGGQAKFLVKAGTLDSTTSNDAGIMVYLNGSKLWGRVSKSSDEDDTYNVDSGWISFGPNDTIKIETETHGDSTQVNNIRLYFGDIAPPTYNGNNFSHSGTVRYNDNLGKDELFLKQGTSINMSLNFSEPVFPSASTSVSENISGKYNFMRTELYDNPGGDGYNPSKYYLSSVDSNYSAFTPSGVSLTNSSQNKFNFSYIVSENDSTDNKPLDPTRITVDLKDKINAAEFIDGAGNPLINVSGIGTVPFANNENPAGTYRTIIDARVPKYSLTKNGIQPDILTGLVLNKNDTIDFTVNLNEKLISQYSIEGTELAFNNGMKAAYVGGNNTETWKFSATIGSGQEISALDVTGLQHSSKQSDGSVLKDYADNFLTEAAKSIKWAGLSVDNTSPVINYVYEPGGATDELYRKAGKITLNAVDPDIAGQASKGIYRVNGNGSGLVYYMWSRSSADPFASKAADNYAAIKRYSLTAKQPSEDLYTNEFKDITLQVANNGETTTPPDSEGIWYLHTWAADMTWDSARQIMQYNKGSGARADYLTAHPEATVAEIEENFRKNILPNLGDYSNLAQWSLSDFKQEDSNWTYKCGGIKFDNTPPEISIGNLKNNNSDNVKLTITASDSEALIKEVYYQFVKEGDKVNELNWTALSVTGANVTPEVSSKDNIMIPTGGKYTLHAKTLDNAGYETIASPVDIKCLVIKTSFKDYGDDYAVNNGVEFTIDGVEIEKLEYAYSDTSTTPSSWTGQLILKDGKYDIPEDKTKNGIMFVHIRVKQLGEDRYYYYFKEYKFDNIPPTATFSSQGFLYPLTTQSTSVSVQDSLVDIAGVADENRQYQWIKVVEGGEEIAPTESSSKWLKVPSNDTVELSPKNNGESGNYRLYVYVKDSLGNGKIYNTSGLFSAYYLSPEPPKGDASIIAVEGNETDGYMAILKLNVDIASKVGYTYSVSANNGVNWTKWSPYTNFIGVRADINDINTLTKNIKVKFKGAFNNVSEVYSPTSTVQDSPVYALVLPSYIDPIRGGEKASKGGANEGLELDFQAINNKTIVASLANPEVPEIIADEADNKSVRIYQNGCYTFQVTDNNTGKKEAVIIVISTFDDVAPQGSVTYSTTNKTNGNVLVTLNTTEPVRMLNEDSKTKLFTENGEYTFEFEDAVGLKGSVTAVVNNINKTPPEIDVPISYNNEKGKFLIDYLGKKVVVDQDGYGYDENGNRKFFEKPTAFNLIASNLVIAEVVDKNNPTGPKNFVVIGNSEGSKASNLIVQKNGTVAFSISDYYGNAVKANSSEITKIFNTPPKVSSVIRDYVDVNGNPITTDSIKIIDGKKYVRGNVKISFDVEASPIVGNDITIGGKLTKDFYRIYTTNGETIIGIKDMLDNKTQEKVVIDELDNSAPTIELNYDTTALLQNQENFDFKKDLGGYQVSDNVSKADNITVTIKELVLENSAWVEKEFDISKAGRHRVKYIAKDELGNESTATQEVIIINSKGMYVIANNRIITNSNYETTIFNTNTITFNVKNYNAMTVGTDKKTNINTNGKFEMYYFKGLYREGEMKYISKNLSYEELTDKNFTVEFETTGWYTIIVRSQEGESIYASFLISNKK